jgi:hypothetical protein
MHFWVKEGFSKSHFKNLNIMRDRDHIQKPESSIRLRIVRVVKVVFFIVSSLIAIQAEALDYPHHDINNIGCDSCHFVYGTEPSLLPLWTAHTPQDIDDTQYNTLCWSCHNDIDAPYVRTHSSLQIDNDYGNWTVECRVCHNPHQQKQFRTYGSASYLYSGTSTEVTTTTITETGAGWTVDEYKGMVVIGNVAREKYNYKILSNTADTLTVEGPIDLTKVTVGDTFAIVYGKLIKSTINTPNSGNRLVKFFRATGVQTLLQMEMQRMMESVRYAIRRRHISEMMEQEVTSYIQIWDPLQGQVVSSVITMFMVLLMVQQKVPHV